MSKSVITDDRVVSLAFSLKDTEGNVLEVATHEDPMAYLHGHSNLLPAVEAALSGRGPGDQITIALTPEEGFGAYDAANKHTVDRSAFGDDDVAAGMPVMVETPSGALTFFVKEVKGDEVVLDGNHPYAGKDLVFDVEVVEIRAATAEEIDHGHAHGPHGHQH